MGRTGLVKNVVAAGVGAVAAWGVEELSSKLFPAKRAELGALGLTTAAVIYPAARNKHWLGAASARELAAVGAAVGLSAAALKPADVKPDDEPAADTRRRRLIAAGWLAHAVFDNVHKAGPGGRLPSWYGALCAGYDVAFAATLLKERRDRGDDFDELE
jgi:hypothetical protein